ncbi:uridine kinase [Saccharomycopsis crataegensis]|uniref:Uridine kinase n=1 Tax=Saccharomycopsis crataegensis TaxID=43959 RepID=A0AAV5QM47_9ASCO|nr:uridine kinase [Saccharomycopsis crataegensis]
MTITMVNDEQVVGKVNLKRIAPSSGESFFTSSSLSPTANTVYDRNIDAGLDQNATSPDSNIGTNTSANETRYIPPWTQPYIIGVAGLSGSGKTSVASKIIEELNTPWTVLISLDNFYNPLTPEERETAFSNEFDFDSPSAVDLDLCYECVKSLKEGNKTKIPVYSFSKHDRTDKEITIYGANVIIIEGIYALYHQKLVDLMNLKIYVDTDLDICLARRLSRDILYRGRDLEGALKQWSTFVKPNADLFVKSTMQQADLVIPRGADNYIAIDMMIKHIQKQLLRKSREHLKYLEKLNNSLNKVELKNIINLIVLKETNQISAINTILTNKATSIDDFIFFFNRISSILISKALELLTYKPSDIPIITPTNVPVDNALEVVEEAIAVNIIRSGDCFMNSLKRTHPEIKIGKLLIQSDRKTGEPQLHSIMLPKNVGDKSLKKKILLMDAQIISGAAVIMSIQVLLDHGVTMEDIIIVCYSATEQGTRRILAAFSKVKIVLARIGSMDGRNKECDNDWWFRTRYIDTMYYGT